MADENKDNSDIYQLRDPAVFTEAVIAPPENSDIFAIKESVIGVTLGAGISLCNAYRLDKRLTSDETGETWKASDLKASRNVVVYLPPLEQRLDTAVMESVSQTARHVEALEHPRIVPLLDNFTDPEHGFFAVRKFINGKTLDVYRKEYIKRYKSFTPAKALKILSDIALTLDFAHRADVVHGVIYPKNIIIGLDDEVNVANFALLPIQSFIPVAKQAYLAPEIIEGLVPTASSDVYALAVVAYELLASRLPVPTNSMDDIPLPIPNVPSSVDAVIRKAMTKSPDDRFDSCGAFVQELEKSFQGAAKNRSILVTPTLASPRKKLPEGLSYGIMLILVFCVTGLAIWHTQPVYESKEQRADVEKQQVVPVPLSPPVERGDRRQTAVEGDGRQQTADGSQTQAETEMKPAVIEGSIGEKSIESVESEIESEPSIVEPVVEPVVEPNVEPIVDAIETITPEIPPLKTVTPLVEQEPEQEKEPAGTSPADMLREDGEEKSLSIGGIEYSFVWHKGNPYLPNNNGFWIQDAPVTQAMWLAVMNSHAGTQPDDVNTRLPEVSVSWRDIEQFLEKINFLDVLANEEFQGRMFALPTENQWESAVPHDKVLEWCSDWSDETKLNRTVRGKDVKNQRDPSTGYDYIGFRLVIVPKETSP